VLLRRNNEWINRPTVDRGPRRLGPFSSCCSIWLAESALLFPFPCPATTAVIDGQARRLNWTSHGDWRRGSAVVQGHTPVHPWVIWLKWVATSGHWSSVHYGHGAATQRPGYFPNFLTATLVAIFGRYTDLLSAGERIIHRSTDFYIVTKYSKVGVRIIFDGILYWKFYGTNSCLWSVL